MNRWIGFVRRIPIGWFVGIVALSIALMVFGAVGLVSQTDRSDSVRHVKVAPTLPPSSPSADASPEKTATPTAVAASSPPPLPSATPTEQPAPTAAPATPSPTLAPVVPPVTLAIPPAAAPQQLLIPSIELVMPTVHAPTTSMVNARGELEPPADSSAYWLSDLGLPGAGSSNTVYIIGHSETSGGWPFNKLSTQLAVGNTITLVTDAGTVVYRVDSVTAENKATLEKSDVWNIVPGRLILISCYTGAYDTTNVVVSASLITE